MSVAAKLYGSHYTLHRNIQHSHFHGVMILNRTNNCYDNHLITILLINILHHSLIAWGVVFKFEIKKSSKNAHAMQCLGIQTHVGGGHYMAVQI